MTALAALFKPLDLPCGNTLKNRIVKSAILDSLGGGSGHPTDAQKHLYSARAFGRSSGISGRQRFDVLLSFHILAQNRAALHLHCFANSDRNAMMSS
ncbi:hypothetical protein [Thalassospira indica]|uniref:hypothetical protein n=1 Tax=Thalassospira indica TaxID=1891279 RepID=UPI0007EB3157|nr:hypothetical protein [Thalassospira indica]OAZ12588.1 hypothetical protein TH15_16640 [Thalassospira profundimaris]